MNKKEQNGLSGLERKGKTGSPTVIFFVCAIFSLAMLFGLVDCYFMVYQTSWVIKSQNLSVYIYIYMICKQFNLSNDCNVDNLSLSAYSETKY